MKTLPKLGILWLFVFSGMCMGNSPIAAHPPAPEFSMIEAIKLVSAHLKKDSEREGYYISKIEMVESSMVPPPHGSSRHWVVVSRKQGEERAKEFILYVSMDGRISETPPSRKTTAEDQSSEPSAEFLADGTYPDHSIRRIAFGSCNKPKRDQSFWDVISAKEPDMMLLLGDNHYGNTSDPVRLKKAYDELAAIPQYRAFRQKIPSFPTWDNHDYGAKYPGRLHPHAEQTEQLFLDHFSIGKTDVRRSRSGVYGAWTFGENPHRVQVIQLDLQRFRDPFQEGTREEQFAAQPGKTLMGAEQWSWFEKQLKKEAEVRLVGSGIQVLSNEHTWRRWGMFPDEREKLLRVVGEAKGTTILLSGDRHRGEFSVLNPAGESPLFDLTASSFNHCYPAEEKNSLRVGELIDQPHFGWLEIDWKESLIKMQLLSAKSGAPLLTERMEILP